MAACEETAPHTVTGLLLLVWSWGDCSSYSHGASAPHLVARQLLLASSWGAADSGGPGSWGGYSSCGCSSGYSSGGRGQWLLAWLLD